MKLEDVILIQLYPAWMRDDASDVALAGAVDLVIHQLAQDLKNLPIWNRIDELPEGMLDELAWALNIEWWDSTVDIAVKRDLIRNSDLVHSKKGTVAAVESVITSYFGSGRVMEWFEYAGDPHHFKCYTTNPTLVAENLDRFMWLLDKVKRKSSKLDCILIGLTGEMHLYAGPANKQHSWETYIMGEGELYRMAGVAISEVTNETVRMMTVGKDD